LIESEKWRYISKNCGRKCLSGDSLQDFEKDFKVDRTFVPRLHFLVQHFHQGQACL
jgi:hypothetical protein